MACADKPKRINEVFYTGEAFHRVAEDIIPDDWIDDDRDGHWFIPSIVNLAFACELYLKFLLFESGLPKQYEHSLKELYFSLPTNIQEKIINSTEFKDDDDFLKNLEENANIFIDWRYPFENKTISVELISLENFASVLHRTAEEILTNSKENNK